MQLDVDTLLSVKGNQGRWCVERDRTNLSYTELRLFDFLVSLKKTLKKIYELIFYLITFKIAPYPYSLSFLNFPTLLKLAIRNLSKNP